MVFLIIFVVLILIILWMAKNHLHIDFKSFFCKGFKKLDDLFGIVCYCAKQGKGKTFKAVEFCEDQSIKNDYEVLTNIKSYADSLKARGRKFQYIVNFNDIIHYVNNIDTSLHPVIIFYDEIFTTLKKSGSLKKEFLSFLSQLRKRKILLITTAQEWSEINITFRRYVRFQVVPNMFPLPFFNTAFMWCSINDGDLIHWDNDSQDFVAPTIECTFSKCKLSTLSLYDTYETISSDVSNLNAY